MKAGLADTNLTDDEDEDDDDMMSVARSSECKASSVLLPIVGNREGEIREGRKHQ